MFFRYIRLVRTLITRYLGAKEKSKVKRATKEDLDELKKKLKDEIMKKKNLL